MLSLWGQTPALAKQTQPLSVQLPPPVDAAAIASYPKEEAKNTAADDEDSDTEERIIILSGVITDETAGFVIAELLRLDAANPDEDIYLYISSPGGSVDAGLGIYDVMQYVQADVVTISVGSSASMAAVLLAAGTPGKRFAFPHARIMIHKPWGGAFGEADDLEIWTRELARSTELFYRLMAFHTGQSISQIRRDTQRDYFMSASEAMDYGIVDQVLDHNPAPED
ncbi:MAG: ATP-dependent Clp protease proteolytic subunit [Spirulinaceae cyanobacterium]